MFNKLTRSLGYAASLSLSLVALQSCYSVNTPSPSDSPKQALQTDSAKQQWVAEKLAKLSLEEKVNLVTGTGFNLKIGASQKVPGAAGASFAIPALDIPAMILADGPAGLRVEPKREGTEDTFYATAFPIATVLASSWDRELVSEVGKAMGNEVKEYGVDLFLAPGMNIHYNPLGGRNFEYYSEDPMLSGNMAAAIVNGIESNGVGSTIKHFVANSAESNRMWLDAHMSERALREIYLRGFEIAVKDAQPWAIMTSYNKVNGTYTSQDDKLLTTVLRDEWGYNGLVMTDWFAGDDPVAQMVAGNDLIMPGMPDQREAILTAVQSGDLDIALLDRNVSNILAVMYDTPVKKGYAYSEKPNLKAHAEVARKAAADGVILLKNDASVLPLVGSMKVAAFGNTSYGFIAGGAGSGDVNEAYTISLVEGLANSHLAVNDKLKNTYEAYIAAEKAKQPPKKNFFELLPPIAEMPVSDALLAEQVTNNDIGVITLGRNSGEFHDRIVAGDFDLTQYEHELIAKVSQAFHQAGKKVVVILNIGNVIETASWRDQVDAILLPWQGGQEAGNAVVDVLTGKVNPSGKLATTFPIAYSDLASAHAFPGQAINDEVVEDPYLHLFKGVNARLTYHDDIFVGYRYYDTFKVPTAYEFGYGLSYTTFGYNDLKVVPQGDSGNFSVSFTVTNTGKVPGKEVAQVYVSAPTSDVVKAASELQGFAKTSLLAPGESQTVTLALSPRAFSYFSEQQHAWVMDAGSYQINIAQSSHKAMMTTSVIIKQSKVVERVKADLAPTAPVQVLLP